MVQYTRENPIVAPHSGAELAGDMNAVLSAILSGHIGETRPPDTAQGMIWVRKIGASSILDVMLYDGNTDVILMSVDSATSGKIVPGAVYDYQEITADGTWVKPLIARSGDPVIVQVVGAGGSGARGINISNAVSGGGGGGGATQRFNDIDLLGATEAVVVGLGGSGRSSDGNGNDGGDSSFGTENTETYLKAEGGRRGLRDTDPVGGLGGRVLRYIDQTRADRGDADRGQAGGDGGRVDGGDAFTGQSSISGGGGGGGAGDDAGGGGPSMYAGGGGRGSTGSGATDGLFPGGGGGGCDGGTSGAGANGVVRVTCIRGFT